MKRREEEEAADGGGGWLVTYSDMITLVLTFFVLMFAMSNVDAMKFALLAAGLSRDGISSEQFLAIEMEYNMHGIGMPDLNNPEYPGIYGESDIEAKKSPDDSSDTSSTGESGNEGDPGEEGAEEDNTNLSELYRRLNVYIIDEELSDKLFLHDGEGDGDNLLITLSNDVWFDSGRADIKEETSQVIESLGKMLFETQNEDNPFDIIISGHTDDVPHSGAPYYNNWGLSAHRALNFMERLIEASEIPPGHFSARGYGEEQPIAPNDTPEGRQANRRVEILVSVLKQRY